MNEQNNALEDFILSNSIVNYLNAILRGELAFIKILQTLNFQGTANYPASDIHKENELEKNIKKTTSWLKEINTGLPIFSTKWNEPVTTQSKQTLQMMGDSKNRLLKLAMALENHLLERKPWLNDETIKLFVACFGFLKYSRENFAKELKEFAVIKNLTETQQQAEKMIEENQELIKIANKLVKELLVVPKKDQISYFEHFWHKFSKLPFEFKTQIQDINQMLHIYSESFDYSMADIPENEANQWENFDIPPHIAGYWRSYNVGPEQAAKWLDEGITDPSIAGLWGVYGITDEEGLKWLKNGITPDDAIEWIKLNFDLSETLKFLELGIVNPFEALQKKLERMKP